MRVADSVTRDAPAGPVGAPQETPLPEHDDVTVTPQTDTDIATMSARVAQMDAAVLALAEELAALRHAATIEPICVGTVEAARLMGVSRSLWCKLNSSGMCPEPVHIGERTLWPVLELREWVAARCPSREQWEQMKTRRKK